MRIIIYLSFIFIQYCSGSDGTQPTRLKCADKMCKENISTARISEHTFALFGELKDVKKSSKVNIKGKNVDSNNSLWLIEYNGLTGFIDLKSLREITSVAVKELQVVDNPYYVKPHEEIAGGNNDKDEGKAIITSESNSTETLEDIEGKQYKEGINIEVKKDIKGEEYAEGKYIEGKEVIEVEESQPPEKIKESRAQPEITPEYFNVDPWIYFDTERKESNIRSPLLNLILSVEKILLSAVRRFTSATGLDSSVFLRNVVYTLFRMSVDHFLMIMTLLSTVVMAAYTPKLLRMTRDWKKEFEAQTRLLVETEVRLAAVEGERARLAGLCHRLEGQVDDHRSKIEEADKRARAAVREVANERAGREAAEREVEAHRGCEGLQGALEAAKGEGEMLRADLAEVRGERDRLREEVAGLRWLEGLVTDVGEEGVARARKDIEEAHVLREEVLRLRGEARGRVEAEEGREAAETRLKVMSDYFEGRGTNGRTTVLEEENGTLARTVARLQAEVREAQVAAHKARSEASGQAAKSLLQIGGLERDLMREREEAKKLRCALSLQASQAQGQPRPPFSPPQAPTRPILSPAPPIFPLDMLPHSRTASGRNSANSISRKSNRS